MSDCIAEIDEVTKRWPLKLRHLLFIRYVLGEPWDVATWLALVMRDQPLTVEVMRFIASRWVEDADL